VVVALLASIGSVFSALLGARAFLSKERGRLARLDEYSIKYSTAMKTLLAQDVEWSTPVLRSIDYWNTIAGDKRFGSPISLILSRIIKDEENNVLPQINPEVEDFFARYPACEVHYAKMIFYAVATAAYSNRLLGLSIIDDFLSVFEDKPKDTERFAEVVQSRIIVGKAFAGYREPVLVTP
jgi:hypothetical protein